MKSDGSAAVKFDQDLPVIDPAKAFSEIYQSRRFGKTMEIDPFVGHQKICSLNCVTCTLGETAVRLNRIKRDLTYINEVELATALSAQLNATSQFDSLVIAGRGEPTLHPRFPELIPALQRVMSERNVRAKTWLLTNGAHFDSRRVIDIANLLDERVIKVDAGTERMYKQISQPLARVTLNRIMATSRQLKDYWVSTTFFSGRISNYTQQEVEEWIEVVGMLKPKGVFIQTTKHKEPHPITAPCTQDDLYSAAARLERKTGIKAKVID